jgi:3-oxoacyl-[acyl-carrier protein] reductase
MLLKGKNAVITGSNRGIGKAILMLFAEHGANIWACARKQTNEFENFINEIGDRFCVEIRPVYFDFADNEQIKNGCKSIMTAKIPIDILVNNAGITYNALLQMTTMDKFTEMFQINFFGQMLLTQFITKLMMKAKNGCVVNIASTAGMDPVLGRTAYGASKASIISVTKILAAELGGYGIRVNAIAPGITNTEMVEASMSDTVIKDAIDSTVLKRLGKPQEIANAVLFLASELSSYVTGQVLRVDGGLN